MISLRQADRSSAGSIWADSLRPLSPHALLYPIPPEHKEMESETWKSVWAGADSPPKLSENEAPSRKPNMVTLNHPLHHMSSRDKTECCGGSVATSTSGNERKGLLSTNPTGALLLPKSPAMDLGVAGGIRDWGRFRFRKSLS